MGHDTVNFIEPRIYKLLSKIRDQVPINYPVSTMTDDELVTLVVDQIKEKGDEIQLPIFREENKFFIYQFNEPIHVPNRSLEKFLLMVGDQLGIDKQIMLSIPWRNQLFGRCWRELAPEK